MPFPFAFFKLVGVITCSYFWIVLMASARHKNKLFSIMENKMTIGQIALTVTVIAVAVGLGTMGGLYGYDMLNKPKPTGSGSAKTNS